jgi:multiple sugar transport system substrate-binding protein
MEAAFGKVVSSNAITRFINDTAKYPRDFTVTVAPLPALEKNQKENYNKGLYYFDYLGMSAQTKNKQAAWTFMKWLATEGSIYLTRVGHLPTWKKTNRNALVKVIFGDDAARKIDVNAFKKTVLDYASPSYNDDEATAYGQVYTILQEEAEKVLFDTGVTVDQAISNMKKRSRSGPITVRI